MDHVRFREGIRAEIIDGEAIVISFETGKYFSEMRGAAADVIDGLMKGPLSTHMVATDLVKRYAVADAEGGLAMVEDFFARLAAAQVVEPDEAGGGIPEGSRRAGGFAFGLAVGEELADVIMLDPVHEVSPAGWPTRMPG